MSVCGEHQWKKCEPVQLPDVGLAIVFCFLYTRQSDGQGTPFRVVHGRSWFVGTGVGAVVVAWLRREDQTGDFDWLPMASVVATGIGRRSSMASHFLRW